jgi:general secretion pathway protein B
MAPVTKANSDDPGPSLRLSPSLRSSKATPPAPAAVQATEQLPSLEQLPPDLRAKLPELAVSGVSYSQSPQLRILIIGGKVYQEQDWIAPNLRLERIGPKAAVLAIDGQRFRLAY